MKRRVNPLPMRRHGNQASSLSRRTGAGPGDGGKRRNDPQSEWVGTANALAMSLALALALAAPGTAHAHSASDAYLTLEQTPGSAIVRLQWDIALRDLDFVLTLDDAGHGDITWGELRRHQAAIASYAQAHLGLLGDGKPCSLSVTRQLVSDHADGAYAALFLEARCATPPRRLALDYRLFFDIDPSHRAIMVARTGPETATALLSPQNARIELELAQPGKPAAAATPR